MKRTEKPVAIVRGVSSGIGLGITPALLEHGHGAFGIPRTIGKSKELEASADLVLVEAVLYFQNAIFVTGENIRVDGGVHANRQ